MADDAEAKFLALFGRRVALARKRLGMTQDEVATKAGLTRASVANMEAGRQNPPLSRLRLLSIALDLDIGDLLSDQPLDPTVLVLRTKAGKWRAEFPDGDYVESNTKATVLDLATFIADRRGAKLIDTTEDGDG